MPSIILFRKPSIITATTLLLLFLGSTSAGETVDSLPVGTPRPAIATPHFPSRLHAYVWRNWECCNLDRMAEVVGATSDQISAIGESMGLPPHRPVSDSNLARTYITIMCRNWHLLPYSQLLTLLGWNADRMLAAYREDDFLWVKMGSFKPDCPPLRYAPPDEAARQRCGEIKSLMRSTFGEEFGRPGVPRFDFVRALSEPLPPTEPLTLKVGQDEPIRFLYSYFAPFGDVLAHQHIDPYPDGLLQRLHRVGVNGVWMQVLLRNLAPSTDFPEFGQGCEQRLGMLRDLVARAGRHGIKVYLYVNEPRAMPASFFSHRPEMKGVTEGPYSAMCSTDPTVRRWLIEATRHVFTQVPGLGGVFTISASESLTNCWSHYGGANCPRCSKRSPAEVIAELNAAIAQGVREGSQGKAATLVWDWGWQNAWCEELINRLPKDAYLMSVSEWELPITRGGVSTAVGEYALSAVGPGPRATRNWQLARKAGLKTCAKIQTNCTWELSTVPYLPVMDLLAQHCENLAHSGVDGTMLSWTLGGYPSPNLALVSMFSRQPAPTAQQALRELASERYGSQAAPSALAAWSAFSKAFAEFPYNGQVIYNGPWQVGPSNLLYAQPTGYAATMVGFPYDDLNGWRGPYPADVFLRQVQKMTAKWHEGVQIWDQVTRLAKDEYARNAAMDRTPAEAALQHFASISNQVEFIRVRDELATTSEPNQRRQFTTKMRHILEEEIAIARRMFTMTRADSTLGYEASIQYVYLPLDMAEKVINCTYLADHLP